MEGQKRPHRESQGVMEMRPGMGRLRAQDEEGAVTLAVTLAGVLGNDECTEHGGHFRGTQKSGPSPPADGAREADHHLALSGVWGSQLPTQEGGLSQGSCQHQGDQAATPTNGTCPERHASELGGKTPPLSLIPSLTPRATAGDGGVQGRCGDTGGHQEPWLCAGQLQALWTVFYEGGGGRAEITAWAQSLWLRAGPLPAPHAESTSRRALWLSLGAGAPTLSGIFRPGLCPHRPGLVNASPQVPQASVWEAESQEREWGRQV